MNSKYNSLINYVKIQIANFNKYNMSQREPTHEVDYTRYIEQKQVELNQFFQSLNIRNDQIQEKSNKPNKTLEQIKKQKSQDVNKPKPVPLNHRGERMYSIPQIRQNYQNYWYGFKWLALPYCKKCIFTKAEFGIGASFVFAYMWGIYQTRKHQKVMTWRNYRNAFGVFSLGACCLSLVESLITENYCNIDSYHYQINQKNSAIAKNIKHQYKQLIKNTKV